MAPPKAHHCLNLFSIPAEALSLEEDERRTLTAGLVQHAGPEGFAPNSLASTASISWLEEAMAVTALFIVLGVPILGTFGSLFLMLLGSWATRGMVIAVFAVLAFHPLPGREFGAVMRRSWFTLCWYKYFSYRLVWCDDDLELCRSSPRTIGAGAPHGVLPFANILAIPAVNMFGFKKFTGAPADALFNTPFLRYLSTFGCVRVDAKSITCAVDEGFCVGVVADGIAGIFAKGKDSEHVALLNRKGLARLALRTGTSIVPTYSLGNTDIFSSWYDPFGFMEYFSRKARAALIVFWGRWGLPIPRSSCVTLCIGKPLVVEKVESPTNEQIDALHSRLLDAFRELFERHKSAHGWGHKNIAFV